MSITIVPVETRRQMNQFIDFTLNLYHDCPYYVPELAFDTRATLDPKKNPAFEFSEAQPMLALKDGKVAGRVVALINQRVNEKWQHKIVRFGWIDFIEDYDVCKALLDAVCAWGKERGMDRLEGPMGFTDFDREGALTTGFDRMATMATIYNYPYYIEYYERYGLVKGADWIEHLVTVPEEIDERYANMSELLSQRYNLHVTFAKNARDMKKNYAKDIFKLLNTCYADLYGFAQLSDRQIDKYVNDYITFADLSLIPMVFDENNNLIAVAIMIPYLAKALIKSHGKLFPFGWFHLLKSLYFCQGDTVEFLLVAIRPDFQSKGINALLVSSLYPNLKKKGFTKAETNCNLVDNDKVINLWGHFPHETHKGRRAFIKDI